MKVGDLVEEAVWMGRQVGIITAIFSWEAIDDYVEVFWLNSKDKERLPTWHIELVEVINESR